MIHWIRPYLGTTAYDSFLIEKEGAAIVDVRCLIDGSGNCVETIRDKIKCALQVIASGMKVVVCCDYGISRSNAVAAGILAEQENLNFNEAVKQVLSATGEKAIKIEVLYAVNEALSSRSQNVHPPICDRRKVLITGGTGFIGSALTTRLAGEYAVQTPHIDLLSGPLELDLIVDESNPEWIVHLANPRIYNNNAALGETLTMLKNVLDVCHTRCVRLLYMSGWEVYSGYRSEGLLASESLPPLPGGIYGETKYLCETLISVYRRCRGLKATLVRSSPVYGVGCHKPKFIYNFLDKARRNEEIVTHRYINGFPCLDLLHISDLVAALELIIENDTVGEINLGTGRGVSTAKVADIIRQMVDSESKISHQAIDLHAPNITMDSTLAHGVLGWKPKVSLIDGLREIVGKDNATKS